MTHERLDATVHGRVQGVGFRYFVIHRAMALDLTGWVSNEPDGTVRCVAEGPRAALEGLVEALEAGPAGALVERVSTAFGPASGHFATFEVRGSGHRGD